MVNPKPLLGQSLSEYVLAGILVAMVAVGALMLVGNSVSGALPDLLDRIFGGAGTPAASAGTPAPPLASSPTSTGSASPASSEAAAQSSSLVMVSSTSTTTGKTATHQSVSITLSGGQTIQLESFPENLKTIVETSGTNGVTQMYAQQIEVLAQSLKESGAISPSQASSLEKLANQGHRIAQAEKAIETAVETFPDSDSFKNGSVVFDGQTVSIKTLADSVSHGELVGDFMALYGAAKSSGALEDDSVKLVVQAMYQDIKALADTFETSVDSVASGGASPSELNQLNAAQISHSDSANICHAGKGKDSGVKCK